VKKGYVATQKEKVAADDGPTQANTSRMLRALQSTNEAPVHVSDNQMQRIQVENDAWLDLEKKVGGSVHLLKGRLAAAKANYANQRLFDTENGGDEDGV
jgi:hypothetical protein